MVIEAGDLIAHFVGDLIKELLVRWVEAARKHKVLPNHQPHFITEIIEPVRFVAPATPDADHVHVGINGRLQKIAHAVLSDLGKQCVGRDPVRTAHKCVVTIHTKSEGRAFCVRYVDMFNVPETNLPCRVSVASGDRQLMKGLRTQTNRPPQIRIGNGQLGGARALFQVNGLCDTANGHHCGFGTFCSHANG